MDDVDRVLAENPAFHLKWIYPNILAVYDNEAIIDFVESNQELCASLFATHGGKRYDCRGHLM